MAVAAWHALKRMHPAHHLRGADLRVAKLGAIHLTLQEHRGTAALVVLKHTCPPSNRLSRSSGSAEEAATGWRGDEVAVMAELLKPGGRLVVVTGLHQIEGRAADPNPQIIARAQQAGLTYLQHIIALGFLARGEMIKPPPSSPRPAEGLRSVCAGLPASTRVHSDLLIFVKPTSAGPPDSPAEDALGQRDKEESR
ncbi:hypothetical protein Acor_84470 [Acrocarpospora corrugata]|uniref:Methyltransferase type 11 domain-containing protein n=1 Tax=Acrocarpospora corrugata TaxID=35763 RepID=A0A5M3WJ30_9ACTN|nr:hypothetical protein [Acrocarpospora corrugata]GES06378.1 hypothetical protein Acor_84470 [Acrocarpospora corrugata]